MDHACCYTHVFSLARQNRPAQRLLLVHRARCCSYIRQASGTSQLSPWNTLRKGRRHAHVCLVRQTAHAVSRQRVVVTSRHGRESQRCFAADPPDRRPKPGRSIAARNRMRDLGLGGDPKKGGSTGMQNTGKPTNGAKPPGSSGKQAKPGNPAERRRRFLLGNGQPEEPSLPSSSMPSQGVSHLDDDEHQWEDWGEWDSDEDWEESRAAYMQTDSYRERRRKAWEGRGDQTPRDAFLRPMVDLQGIKYRLGFNSEKASQEIQDEFDENRWESQEALKYFVLLIGVPLLTGFTVSRLLADPFFEVLLKYDTNAFALSDRKKVEGAHEVHMHEMRLRMDAALGKAPPLTEIELQAELRREAKHLAKEYKEHSRQAFLNLLSDGTSAALIFGILLRPTEGRKHFFRTLSRFASGLSDTAKAFLIIAGTDILLGYHSEEGWTAAIRLLTGHYGMEVEEAPIYIFVAIVPVVMDAIFKYWIFKGLNRQNPAAAATLRSMDRH